MIAKAFLFDIGNVLVRFDFAPATARLADLSEVSASEAMALISPFKDDLESGRISSQDFVTQCLALTRFHGTEEDFITLWCDIFTENAPMIALVEELAKEHPLYLLSNTNALHKDWLFARFPVFQHFKGGIFSHEAGCMKPHDEIYEAALSQLGLDPAETLYIDDLSDNIVAGERFGFVCHQYSPDNHQALLNVLHS
jgi:glucose-1-phosphatase